MIVRIWHGRTSVSRGDAYEQFLRARAIPDYRSVSGNLGAFVLRRDEPGALRFAAAALAYLIGAVGVTAARNVPLNDALALIDPNAADAASHWHSYLTQWNAWNHVRTVACIVAAGLLAAA